MDDPRWFVPNNDELPLIAKGYHTNNKYDEFLGIMQDGRAFQCGYLLDADRNQALLKETGIRSNFEYRRYLQQNAQQIIRRHCQETMEATNTHSFVEPPLFQLPKMSDLATLYLTREELEKNKFSPIYKGPV
jgi:hypothetical protein